MFVVPAPGRVFDEAWPNQLAIRVMLGLGDGAGGGEGGGVNWSYGMDG